MTSGNDQCTNPSTWHSADYDRDATWAFIQQIRATGQVKLIFFNDPQLISEGLTQQLTNHDDHLHGRFYERGVSSLYSR